MRDHPSVPTLREIAAAAGVSTMTVSRALKNSRLHRSATCQKIQQIARDLGWKPNPLVSALMSQRARQHGVRLLANLAILDPRSNEPAANGIYILGSNRQAHELGYGIETFPFHPESSARLRKILIARGVQGIVVMPVPAALSRVDFDFTSFAAATIGYSVSNPMPRVANDTQNALYLAFQQLEQRGYKRVGLIMADDANRRMLCLYSGARMTYNRFFAKRLTIKELNLPDEVFTPTRMRQILTWIRKERVQAVLSSAEHLHRKLTMHNASIPGDFGYLHLHKHTDPRVTSMDQMRDFIGQKAVDVVAGMIQRNERYPVAHPHTILTPSVWLEGETIQRLPVTS